MGGVYQLVFLRSINPAATAFATVFVLEGVLLLTIGGWLGGLRFAWTPTVSGVLGAAFIAYALIVYPILPYLLGQRYPATPTFGLPCPTTILIPLACSALGASATVQRGEREDPDTLAATMAPAEHEPCPDPLRPGAAPTLKRLQCQRARRWRP
jgi:hypothetical protein